MYVLCFNLTEHHNINGVYSLQKYKARMSYLYFWRLYARPEGFEPSTPGWKPGTIPFRHGSIIFGYYNLFIGLCQP